MSAAPKGEVQEDDCVRRAKASLNNVKLSQVTIDDPPMYTRPWKVASSLTRDDKYRIYEYACHEGNHAVENVLSGGRALDNAKAGAVPNR